MYRLLNILRPNYEDRSTAELNEVAFSIRSIALVAVQGSLCLPSKLGVIHHD